MITSSTKAYIIRTNASSKMEPNGKLNIFNYKLDLPFNAW